MLALLALYGVWCRGQRFFVPGKHPDKIVCRRLTVMELTACQVPNRLCLGGAALAPARQPPPGQWGAGDGNIFPLAAANSLFVVPRYPVGALF